MVIIKVVPLPGLLVKDMVPLSKARQEFTIFNPSPVPWMFMAFEARKNLEPIYF